MGQFTERPYNVGIVGAASGIGRAAARALAAEGARVVSLDSNVGGAGETAVAISATGQTAFVRRLDVTDPPGVAATMATVVSDVDQLHGLVNCAGITGRPKIKGHEVDLEDLDRVYRITAGGRTARGDGQIHAR